MRFSISSTSGDVNIPGVTTETYKYIDQRTVDTPTKLNHMSSEEWYAEGSNHGVNDVGIYRHLERLHTNDEISIESLSSLLDFVKRWGTVILSLRQGHLVSDPEFDIEIYDNYRE